jgi:hypothetical protein
MAIAEDKDYIQVVVNGQVESAQVGVHVMFRYQRGPLPRSLWLLSSCSSYARLCSFPVWISWCVSICGATAETGV